MHFSATDAGISSNSRVRGSEIIETNPLLMKQSVGSSMLSLHTLTHSPHFIHLAFSKIRPVLLTYLFKNRSVYKFSLWILQSKHSLPVSLNLQLSAALQSQCMQLSASADATEKSVISLCRIIFSLHSLTHSCCSLSCRIPIREENLLRTSSPGIIWRNLILCHLRHIVAYKNPCIPDRNRSVYLLPAAGIFTESLAGNAFQFFTSHFCPYELCCLFILPGK